MTDTAATILAVDDDGSVLGLLGDILRQAGYRVLLANGGWSAIQAYEKSEERVHLLLTDVIMPKLSGPELAKWLLARRPEVKVLYMSGYTDDKLREVSVSDSGIALLQKPFRREDLMRKLKELLARKTESARPSPFSDQPQSTLLQ